MQIKPALEVCAKASPRVQFDWKKADERALVQGAVAGNRRATGEFRRRFDNLLRKRIRNTLMRTSFALATKEMIDQIRGGVYGYLLRGPNKPLAAFDERHGTLVNWMSRLGHACTMRRLEELTNLPSEGEEESA